MANLTLAVDDELLRRARIKALERGTSVNGLVRRYLEDFAGPPPARAAMESFLARAAESTASSGPGGRTWTRDELYDV